MRKLCHQQPLIRNYDNSRLSLVHTSPKLKIAISPFVMLMKISIRVDDLAYQKRLPFDPPRRTQANATPASVVLRPARSDHATQSSLRS